MIWRGATPLLYLYSKMLLKDNLKQILEIKLKDINAYLVDLEIIEKKSIIISIDRFEGIRNDLWDYQ